MSQPLNILGISGSLRHGSYNTAALRAAQALAPAGMRIEIADLSEIPLYNEDVRGKAIPLAVERLAGQIRAADGLLFATPEYNYSVSGVLKNTIDWLSRLPPPQPFADKPAAIMGASIGLFGTARAQYHLRQIMIYLDVHFLNRPEVMIGQAQERFDGQGALIHQPTRELLAKMLVALDGWTRRLTPKN